MDSRPGRKRGARSGDRPSVDGAVHNLGTVGISLDALAEAVREVIVLAVDVPGARSGRLFLRRAEEAFRAELARRLKAEAVPNGLGFRAPRPIPEGDIAGAPVEFDPGDDSYAVRAGAVVALGIVVPPPARRAR